MCTALQGTQEVRDYPSFCRMRQLGVLLLQRVPKRPGVIVVFVEWSSWGYYYFTGYQKGQALSQFLKDKAAGVLLLHRAPKRSHIIPVLVESSSWAYYYFTGYPIGQVLSQFLKNEAAGSITTSQGKHEVQGYPCFCVIKHQQALLLHGK